MGLFASSSGKPAGKKSNVNSADTKPVPKKKPAPQGGCCQVSQTNNRCANYEYAHGKCVALTKRSIGCNRGFWATGKVYSPHTGKCETATTAATHAAHAKTKADAEKAAKAKALKPGCCQVSQTNNRCANYEYAHGKCVALTKRSIGCNRG